MNARQRRAKISRHHYGFDAHTGLLYVREPATKGSNIVCRLTGDPSKDETVNQAQAICAALDRLMKAAEKSHA